MRGMVTLGIILLIAWAVGFVVFKTAGFLIHLLLIVGAVFLLVGLIRRVGGGRASTRI